ncbi:MAG TPA: hypothetical protein VGH73_11960 [Thermoanaerobaculia bacterium]|jgi:hypothetical protein
MDVILIPPAGESPGSSATHELYQPLGEQRLEALITWLIDRGELSRLYAFLPEEAAAARWTLGYLGEAGRKFGVEVSLLLPPERLTADLLEALHARGILDLILTAGAGSFGACRAALAALDDYRAGRAVVARSGRGFSCRLWLEAGEDGADYRRLAALTREAPGLAIDTPAFGLATQGAGRTALPEALLSRSGSCRLFELSLTVDPSGGVWMCSRQGGAAEGRLGDLFTDTPEELLAGKDGGRARVGTTAACRSCGVRGRFQWPESEPTPLAAQPAAPGAGVARKRPDRPPLTQEVSALDPRQAGEALAEFEARLEAWSTRLADWEADGQS